VRLPDLELDDRRFQDLVDEARRRIGQQCPEWTDHNVASPGIMLTELFAWMTEMLSFRLNQVPDKVHLRLLELLDVQLRAPRAATAQLRFLLGGPAAEPVTIPAHATEVATQRSETGDAIVFATTAGATIPPARPIAYVLQRDGGERDVGLAAGVAQPVGQDRCAFSSPPVPGDALLLGFSESLASLVMRVQVDCSEAQGAGIKPDDPPLRWEASVGAGGWVEAQVLVDETGGFNYGGGQIDLQLPDAHGRQGIAGHDLFWLRCRVDARTRAGDRVAYGAPPEITQLTAAPVGALLPAAHAEQIEREVLGESDGTPGQNFRVRHAPALPLEEGETLEVLDPGGGEWVRWERRETFGASRPHDLHFRFYAAHGELELGPCLRAEDGAWLQYGAVPPKGATLRLSRYRHGGGVRGNVRSGTLTELRSAIPGVAQVANPRPAVGGVDGETLEHARRRAALELRVGDRAVTAGDFARQAERATSRVARAICQRPRVGEPIRVVILPRVTPSDGAVRARDLMVDDALRETVARHLDERRLLGATVDVAAARIREVSVAVDAQIAATADAGRIEEAIRRALDQYLDPLTGGRLGGGGDGWEFGRALHQGELYGVVQSVAGVRFVRLLRLYEVDRESGKPAAEPVKSRLELGPDEVLAPAVHSVRTRRDG
jgi:predicted phage baseplate assembly protein